jgi:hypothetical protein
MTSRLPPDPGMTAMEVQMVQEAIRFHAANAITLEGELTQVTEPAIKALLENEVRRNRHRIHIWQEILANGETH